MLHSHSTLRRTVLLLALTLASTATAQESRGHIVGPSGLPLPRFASLGASTVNVRTGPSLDNPIRWVYSRPGLPVRIVEESDVWRRIEDPDGESGWTHSSLLSVRRTVMVNGPDDRDLRRSADAESRIVAKLEPGVIAELDGCEGDWCRIEVEDQWGWMPRGELWGAAADE